jgi:hypothetical protein
MILLGAPFYPRAVRCPESTGTIWLAAVALAVALIAIGAGVELHGGAGRDLGRAVASAGIHSGMLAAGWFITVGRSGPWVPLAWVTGSLCLASIATWWSAWGAVCYALPPLLLARQGARLPGLRRIGMDLAAGRRYLPHGLAAGAFLGAHLLVSASMTLGYSVHGPTLAHYLPAVAYDVGANALTAEWLFRGAFFSRWWRRWEFWPAAGLATGLIVCRYLVDPALPLATEVRAGAVLYMLVLGFATCALRAVSGSLLPGYVATIAFFAAYRTLTP